MKELLCGSRSIIADHITDDLIDICRAVEDWTPYTERTDSAQQACEILANWDRRFKVESVGAHLFREVHWGWIDRFRTPDL